MSRPEQNFDPGRPDDLDRSIDAVLAKLAAVEPRPGLEERILANLRGEQNEAPSRTWWYWGIATALTAVALVSIALIWRSAKPSAVITTRAPANVQVSTPPRNTPVDNEIVAIARPVHAPIRRTVAQAKKPVAAAEPKLDQFPSPQPLSAEEIALARYVKNFPKEARLVAQTQEDFELETRKIMNDASSETSTSNPVQLER